MIKASVAYFWADFLNTLDDDAPYPSKTAFIETVILWIKLHKHKFKGIRCYSSLLFYFDIDVSLYPVEYSDMDIAFEIAQKKRNPPNSFCTFAMFIEGIIWNAITYKCIAGCPVCASEKRILFVEGAKPRFIFSCDTCTRGQELNGDVYKKNTEETIVIPKTNQLLNAGFICI